MGRDDLDKTIVEMWQRRIEFEGYGAAGDAVGNSAEMLKDRGTAGVERGFPQIPALIERGKSAFALFLDRLDQQLSTSQYIACEHFTIADMTALVTIDFAKRADIEVPENKAHIHRWYKEVSAQPSRPKNSLKAILEKL